MSVMWDSLESLIGLHEEIRISYLVDRYRLELAYDGNDNPVLVIEAKKMQTCFIHLSTYSNDILRKWFWDKKPTVIIRFDGLE